MGPFIDVQHPKIKNGETDMVPAALFHSHFIEPLQSFLDTSPGSIAVLVPSIRDIINTQAVFPQGELGLDITKSDPVSISFGSLQSRVHANLATAHTSPS